MTTMHRPSFVSIIIVVLGVAAAATFFVACGGLDPTAIPPFTGISGTITVKGGTEAWPTDSCLEVRAVAFLNAPTKREDVLTAILTQQASLSDTIPRYRASMSYQIPVAITPRTFNYVVLAMRVGPDATKDWKMIAVHSETNDPLQPSPVSVAPNQVVTIPFTVDFANLPPQPFE